MTPSKPNANAYAPPRAQVADHKTPRIRPSIVNRAVAALWVAYALTFTHAIIAIGDRWTSWPPEQVVYIQAGSELFNALLIYCISRGQYWARLVYAVTLGVRTLNVIRYLPADWADSHSLVVITAFSFACQYAAMYWLFTEPGRRWFMHAVTN